MDQRKQVNSVLIIAKSLDSIGGISNYYSLFFKAFDTSAIDLLLFEVGTSTKYYYHQIWKRVIYFVKLFFDCIRFLLILLGSAHVKIIQVNPSITYISLFRDAIFVVLGKIFRRKVVVFFRGWREWVLNNICSNVLLYYLFKRVYLEVDTIVVLAYSFKENLITLGVPENKIVVSRTMFDKRNIITYDHVNNQVATFLFVGRFSKDKGVYDILDAISVLKDEGIECKMKFVGYGKLTTDENILREYAKERNIISYCEFEGYKSGPQKYHAYASADIFIFPSKYEGCPNVVIEALGSGLFVLCSDVGALKEIVTHGVNGRIMELYCGKHIAANMAWCIKNIDHIRSLRKSIKLFAEQYYEKDIMVEQFKALYMNLLSEKI